MNIATTIESANQVRWDLSPLYSDIEDPRLDADLKTLAAMAKHFSATYKGKLAERLGPAIKDYSEIEMLERQDHHLSVFAGEHGPFERCDQSQACSFSAGAQRSEGRASHVL